MAAPRSDDEGRSAERQTDRALVRACNAVRGCGGREGFCPRADCLARPFTGEVLPASLAPIDVAYAELQRRLAPRVAPSREVFLEERRRRTLAAGRLLSHLDVVDELVAEADARHDEENAHGR